MTNILKVLPSGEREIVVTRSFDAPRKLVFGAWTRPDLLTRWLYGPQEWRLAVCEIDLRVGGGARFVWRHRDAREMGMSGTYREIAAPERLAFTELWDEDWTGGEALVTTVLAEHSDKTTLTQTILYSSRSARDAVLKTPMEQGMAQSYDRLDQVLASTLAREGARFSDSA
ncbi:MAG TPA: SRPBCC family protein [Stellaceae bacterium]|nr:SRPBCC family protein [Stellaceae bacterium]